MTVSGVRSSRSSAGAKRMPRVISRSPPTRPKVTEEWRAFSARSRFPAPMAWAATTLVPTEMPEKRPMVQVMRVALAPTAAAAVWSRQLPTKMKSTVL